MKTFLDAVKTSVITLAILTLILGVVYPVFMWGIGQIFFPKQANGQLFFYQDGKVLGSEWIAQNFTSDKYFHPRPSAAGNNGYDASNSSGSNLGPTSKKLIETLNERLDAYRKSNQLGTGAPVPADAITASGSGLDPHIGVENARLQAKRVAAARNLSANEVDSLIDQYTEGRTFGIFGDERINVLRINLALDKKTAQGGS